MTIYTWEKLTWMHDVEDILTCCALVIHNRIAMKVWPIEAQGWLYDVRDYLHQEYDKQDGKSLKRFIDWAVMGNQERADFLVKEVICEAFPKGEIRNPRYVIDVDYMIESGLVKHKQLEFTAKGDHDAMDKVLQAYVEQDDEFPWSVVKLKVYANGSTTFSTDMTEVFNKFAGNLLK